MIAMAKENNDDANSSQQPIIIESDDLEEGEVTSDSEENLCSYSNKKLQNKEDTHSKKIYNWSHFKFLMIGDERTLGYDLKHFTMFPSQTFKHLSNANIKSLCKYIDSQINSSFDVVVIFGFHYDFVNYTYDERLGYQNGNLMLTTRPNILGDIPDMLNTVRDYNEKWKKQHPSVRIIWTVPNVPNFLEANGKVIDKITGNNVLKHILRSEQNEFSRRYFSFSTSLTSQWRSKLYKVLILPLNDVLFVNKHHYRKSFEGRGAPSFPSGFLLDGTVPTKMMAFYFAFVLLEYIVEKKIFSQIKLPKISISQVEKTMLQFYPQFTDYVHQPRHKSKKRRSDSVLSSDSVSSSRSCSSSKSKNHRSTASRSNHHHKSKRKTTFIENNKKRRRSSESSSSSDSILFSLSPVKNTEGSPKELEYNKNLKNLREVHAIYCNIYRRDPKSHHLYVTSYDTFIAEGGCDTNWTSFWAKKLEEIFAKEWDEKKKNLTLEFLNRKRTVAEVENCEEQPPLVIDLSNNPLPVRTIDSNNKGSKLLFDLDSLLESSANISSEKPVVNPPTTCVVSSKSDKLPAEHSPESSINLDIDDIDGLIDDPNFLADLDEINNVIHKVESESANLDNDDDDVIEVIDSPIKEEPKSPEKVFSSKESSDVKKKLLAVLQTLSHLSKHLGPIGLSVTALLEQHKHTNDQHLDINEDVKTLLTLVNNRIHLLLKDNLSQVQKAIFNEVSEQLNNLLKTLSLEYDKFAGVNIQNIANATIGESVQQVIKFIKNTLSYHGFSDASANDVMNLYMSVKSCQNQRNGLS